MRLKVLADEPPAAQPVDIFAAFLERDPLVREFKPESVFCDECGRWVSTGRNGGLRSWHQHCKRPTHGRTE